MNDYSIYPQDRSPIPIGWCQCGCGEKTPIYKCSNKRTGAIKGQPSRFITGHVHKLRFPEDFHARTDKRGPGECWNWLGTSTPNGYGTFGGTAKYLDTNSAHRIAYMLEYGPIPEGLVIDHTCKNRLCVNPAHLEAVTQQVNATRGDSPIMEAYRENRCTRGHIRTPENTYTWHGHHHCLQCFEDRKEERNKSRRKAYANRPKARSKKFKISPEQAAEIIKLHNSGFSLAELGRNYDVSSTCISAVINNPDKYR